MKIQFDVVHQDYVKQNPEVVYASNLSQFEASPAQLLSDVVVEADGSVIPVSYGLSKKFQICNIHKTPLHSGWEKFIADGTYLSFRNLCKSVFEELSKPQELPFFNWYEMLVAHSYTVF